jgi:DNA-binding transcriptional LysR family regulator
MGVQGQGHMIPITFRQMEVFAGVVEAGSFRACAERLSISQASVGEHIRTLERQLECVLFERNRGSAAVLTQTGERVFSYVQRILASTNELMATFDKGGRGLRRRRIRVGTHGFIALGLAKRLNRFQLNHPEVEIELEARSFDEVRSGLLQNEIEIGFFLARGPVAELDSLLGWELPVDFFVGKGHPLAERRVVTAADLSGQPYVYLPARTHLRGEIDAILRDLNITDCPVAILTDDYTLALERLRTGDCFGSVFSEPVQPNVDRGEIVRLPFEVPIPPVQVRYAVRSPFQRDNTIADLVWTLNNDK